MLRLLASGGGRATASRPDPPAWPLDPATATTGPTVQPGARPTAGSRADGSGSDLTMIGDVGATASHDGFTAGTGSGGYGSADDGSAGMAN